MIRDINDQFKNIDDKAMLRPSEIAKLLRVHKETVRRWCRNGMLPAYNWGGKYVICGSDFKSFMQQSHNLNRVQQEVIG
jgi:excisionase family DNA binding protein